MQFPLHVVIVLLTFYFNRSFQKIATDRCLVHNNKCINECPEGMVKVTGNCSISFWLAQRTCENPEKRFVGRICGFARCDCPDPQVLDTETGTCYDLDNCPAKHKIN